MKQTFDHGRLKIVVIHGFLNHKCCNTLSLIPPLGNTKTGPRKLEKIIEKIIYPSHSLFGMTKERTNFFEPQKMKIFTKCVFFSYILEHY
jgi:hypothetical protein